MIVFDIETGPLAEEVIFSMTEPFSPPLPPKPREVKLGHLKDPEKIAAKKDEIRRANATAEFNYKANVAELEHDWRANAINRAALSPLTGRVLAIGYLMDVGPVVLDVMGNKNGFTESHLLNSFWARRHQAVHTDETLVGHNIFGFDLPFLIRRSWLLNIEVPGDVFHGRYFNDRLFVDTIRLWSCGDNRHYVSLDTLARAMGIGGKPDGVDGGMFAELLKTDRQAALDYLRNDLDMTAKVAERMGVI